MATFVVLGDMIMPQDMSAKTDTLLIRPYVPESEKKHVKDGHHDEVYKN